MKNQYIVSLLSWTFHDMLQIIYFIFTKKDFLEAKMPWHFVLIVFFWIPLHCYLLSVFFYLFSQICDFPLLTFLFCIIFTLRSLWIISYEQNFVLRTKRIHYNTLTCYLIWIQTLYYTKNTELGMHSTLTEEKQS